MVFLGEDVQSTSRLALMIMPWDVSVRWFLKLATNESVPLIDDGGPRSRLNVRSCKWSPKGRWCIERMFLRRLTLTVPHAGYGAGFHQLMSENTYESGGVKPLFLPSSWHYILITFYNNTSEVKHCINICKRKLCFVLILIQIFPFYTRDSDFTTIIFSVEYYIVIQIFFLMLSIIYNTNIANLHQKQWFSTSIFFLMLSSISNSIFFF